MQINCKSKEGSLCPRFSRLAFATRRSNRQKNCRKNPQVCHSIQQRNSLSNFTGNQIRCDKSIKLTSVSGALERLERTANISFPFLSSAVIYDLNVKGDRFEYNHFIQEDTSKMMTWHYQKQKENM